MFGALSILGFAVFVGMEWVRTLVATVVGAYAVILFTPITNVMADSLVVNCSDTAGDAIVVLGGDPGYARILHGLRLLGQGGASVLVITGDEGRPGGWQHDEVATLFGVREDRLVRLTPAGSGTRGESEALRAAPQASDFRRIILVTSRIHSLRATLTFRKVGYEICSAPAPDRNNLSDFRDPWGRVLMARDLVHEGLGLAYYKAQGWI